VRTYTYRFEITTVRTARSVIRLILIPAWYAFLRLFTFKMENIFSFFVSFERFIHSNGFNGDIIQRAVYVSTRVLITNIPDMFVRGTKLNNRRPDVSTGVLSISENTVFTSTRKTIAKSI